jgi:predicted secreted protein
MNKLLMLVATSMAAAAVAATAQPTATAPEEKPAKEKQVCRSVGELGSRLNRRRVCATKAQWDEMGVQNRLAIDRVQNGRQTTGN